ncbi:MAG: hypothetical protein WBM17_17085, partial [Anaerolineales bacterium]
MNMQPNAQPSQEKHRRSGLLWAAVIVFVILVCGALAAPGGARSVWAQGISPTLTPPTPYQCMYIVYSFATETSIVVGVRNNTGSTTRLSSATMNWPSGLSGDYVDYFTFYTGTFYTGNDSTPPTNANTPATGTAYDIANNVTREFVAAFGPLPLPTPLAGTFTVTLVFSNGCSVSATVTLPAIPTPTPQGTYTPVAGQCNIAYAYVTELAVVVGVRNNTAATRRLSTTTLDWPAGIGGTGGDYVDYFQFNGNQFYAGNDTAPTTAATPANSALYDIAPGQTRVFVAAFGLAPLFRPLYGTFTATFTFRSGCSPVTISVSRTPPPSTCPTITNAYISAADLYFVVYNNLAGNTNFTGATLNWTDIPSPNRYVNYFAWGTDQFYPGNDNDPPTSANDASPDLFAAGTTSFFRVNFGNPGVLSGTFTVTLNFSVPCSTTYALWWGVSPTVTRTPTRTLTPTATATTIPLAGSSSVRYAAILLNAPDFGLPAQTITGRVVGGGGPPYTVSISVEDPDGNIATYGQNVELDGTFELLPAETGDVYF